MARLLAVGIFLVIAAWSLLVAAGAAEATDSTVQELIASDDPTTCRDGIGWTYDHETMSASTESPELAAEFLARHQSCYGGPDGLLRLAIRADCSPNITIPDRNAAWVICLIWFTYDLGGDRLLVQPQDFQLIAGADRSYDASTDPLLYSGQRDDISGGVYLLGNDGRFGLVAFPVHEVGIESPLLLYWEVTGDVLIVDLREPEVGRKFLERDWS